MIRFEPMTDEVWRPLLDESIAGYAKMHVQAGRWTEQEALKKARDEYEKLLPDGVATEKHHVYAILEDASDRLAGHVWYMEREQAGSPSVFLCDILILEAFRRRGFARAALEDLEAMARGKHGATRLELHVFANNEGARELYRKAGFVETNVRMAKEL